MSKTKKERDYPAKPKDKTSIISIDPSYSGRFRGIKRNPLDAELESEDAMLAHDLKSMRVDELILKRRARMAKLQKEIDTLEKNEKNKEDNPEASEISLAMVRQIAQLPEEEKQNVIQTYAMFRSIDQSKGRRDALLPLLIGYSKTNPGSSQSDMATYAKAMADQFKTGIDVMKSVMPKDKPSNATEILKLFKDLVTDSVQKPMDEIVRKLQHQPGVFEQLLTNPDLYNRAKEIGIFGGRDLKGASNEMDLKIEQLRGERDMMNRKYDLENRKMMLEMEAKERRTDTMLGLIGPLSALVSGPLDQRMRQLGRNTAGHHNPGPESPIDVPILRVVCNECGYDENLPLMGPPPEKMDCPGCGVMLNIGGTPTGDA